MKWFLLFSGIALILGLVVEQILATRRRRLIKHVIQVNGTRGKSGVTRLIGAALSAGGYRVLVKTTGTVPMMILPSGEEKTIERHGPANIKEQLWVLKQAVKEQADVLVVECMAVDPELQYVSEHKMLHSDIGVITNARVDHVAEMGKTETEVAEALLNTLPKGGTLVTADPLIAELSKKKADVWKTKVILAGTHEQTAEENSAKESARAENEPAKNEELRSEVISELNEFPENIDMALQVAKLLDVDEKTAISGLRSVQKDPYASFGKRLQRGVLFVDSMSANDPVSTKQVFQKYTEGAAYQRKIIILNNRADRGYRTNLMVRLITEEKPQEVWLLGAHRHLVRQRIFTAFAHEDHVPMVRIFKTAAELPIAEETEEGTVLWAIGNIKDEGRKLSDRVKALCQTAGDAENPVKASIDDGTKQEKEETECTVK